MLSNQRASLANYAYIQTKRLKVLHHYFDEKTTYPRDPRFKSAIYDIEHVKIFSLLEDEAVQFDKEIYLTERHYIHFVKTLDTYYLGTRYLILEVEDDGTWRDEAWKQILIYGFGVLILFILFGLFLAKLFVKPMRDSILLLDRFIKDTTHELNTPLSAILANIEMMDTSVMVEKNRKKLERISIAAKMVSQLYKDLTFATLEQEKRYEDEEIAIKPLLKDRVEYFNILARSKNVKFELVLEHATVMMEKRKLVRVIDNLISNAIKYNKRGGKIKIVLKENMLSIEDKGIGISQEELPFIFDRYMRFNQSEGGFGLGLSIVKQITDEYGIKIVVESQEGEGTKMILRFEG